MTEGKITIKATIPQTQGAFKSLDGGGARITLDLDVDSASKYFQFWQLSNTRLLWVTGELGFVLPEQI